VTPYYEQDGIAIYHGDSRLLIFELPSWDVVVCDPPYGVNLGVGKDMRGGSHGLAKSSYASYDDSDENFRAIVLPVLTGALLRSKRGAIFAGPRVQDLPKGSVVGGVHCPAASGRHRWGFNCFLPVVFYGTAPELNKGGKQTVIKSTAVAEKNGHPCPKPIEWMEWLVSIASLSSEKVIDPFMGSGTTLLAAQRCGRRAIGIEIEERYCEIAAKRLSQGVLQMEASA
jgi:site-specific DNA-methyltransferase (adenine-specific)